MPVLLCLEGASLAVSILICMDLPSAWQFASMDDISGNVNVK
jgi:hypothetical protein